MFFTLIEQPNLNFLVSFFCHLDLKSDIWYKKEDRDCGLKKKQIKTHSDLEAAVSKI